MSEIEEIIELTFEEKQIIEEKRIIKAKLKKFKNNALDEQTILLKKRQKCKIHKMLSLLNKYNIIYHSTSICLKRDINNEIIIDENNRIKKDGHWEKKEKKQTTIHNDMLNGSFIFTGAFYNLICFDIDNIGDNINDFQILLANNNYLADTLTFKTLNEGLHYYFRLTEIQQEKLKNFQTKTAGPFGFVDVKYSNSLVIGPTFVNHNNKEYSYKIKNDSEPDILPDFLFNELLKSVSNKEIKSKSKKIIKPNIESTIDNINDFETDKRVIKIRLYADCLNSSRWTNFDSWLRLGYLFSDFFKKSEIGYLLFKIYSKKTTSNNFEETACFDLYYNPKNEEYVGEKITIRSLYLWANEDNKTLFYINSTKDKEYLLDEIFLTGINDNMAARLFFNLHENKFLYDADNKYFYKINEYGIWKR